MFRTRDLARGREPRLRFGGSFPMWAFSRTGCAWPRRVTARFFGVLIGKKDYLRWQKDVKRDTSSALDRRCRERARPPRP